MNIQFLNAFLQEKFLFNKIFIYLFFYLLLFSLINEKILNGSTLFSEMMQNFRIINVVYNLFIF